MNHRVYCKRGGVGALRSLRVCMIDCGVAVLTWSNPACMKFSGSERQTTLSQPFPPTCRHGKCFGPEQEPGVVRAVANVARLGMHRPYSEQWNRGQPGQGADGYDCGGFDRGFAVFRRVQSRARRPSPALNDPGIELRLWGGWGISCTLHAIKRCGVVYRGVPQPLPAQPSGRRRFVTDSEQVLHVLAVGVGYVAVCELSSANFHAKN